MHNTRVRAYVAAEWASEWEHATTKYTKTTKAHYALGSNGLVTRTQTQTQTMDDCRAVSQACKSRKSGARRGAGVKFWEAVSLAINCCM